MKIMNVSLTIDVQNAQQREALKQLMDALGNDGTTAPVQVTAPEPAPTPVVEKAKVKRNPKAVAEEPQKVEEDMPQACAPEPEPEEDLVGETAVTIDLATLRSKTAEKSILNRAEIKAKLAEYGAANVTSIPEEYYADYYTFITSL
jgi:hypothetical protein